MGRLSDGVLDEMVNANLPICVDLGLCRLGTQLKYKSGKGNSVETSEIGKLSLVMRYWIKDNNRLFSIFGFYRNLEIFVLKILVSNYF